MHGWYDLCFNDASQLFPLCDLLSPSGMSFTNAMLDLLYLFKLCYTAENTCFSAFRVLFPITARLEHAAYLNNESMLSWFKGDSHLFYFFHIFFFCLLYLLTFEQYNVMICCCLYGLQKCNTSSFSCIFHFLDSLSSLYLTQVLALAYYTISYFPGGSSGLKFISSSLLSSVTSCFGR